MYSILILQQMTLGGVVLPLQINIIFFARARDDGNLEPSQPIVCF